MCENKVFTFERESYAESLVNSQTFVQLLGRPGKQNILEGIENLLRETWRGRLATNKAFSCVAKCVVVSGCNQT